MLSMINYVDYGQLDTMVNYVLLERYLGYNTQLTRALNHDRSHKIHVLRIVTDITDDTIWNMV